MLKIILQFCLLIVAAVAIGIGGWIAAEQLVAVSPVATSQASESDDLEAGRRAVRAGNYDEAFVILDHLAWSGDPVA